MDLDNDDQQDTLPGFKMQSENFVLKFITGLQKGVCSKLLEFETDWYDMMEILLSRLEDEPVNQDKFQDIASKDLENWALIQPGGDTLKLKIKVEMEEKLYLRQVLANASVVKSVNPTHKQLGNIKTIKLTFSDRYTTQVVFHAKKKALKEASASWPPLAPATFCKVLARPLNSFLRKDSCLANWSRTLRQHGPTAGPGDMLKPAFTPPAR